MDDEGMQISAVDQILSEIEKALFEMRSLAQFAARDDLPDWRRSKVQTRIDELKREIDGIAEMLIPPDVPIQ